MGCLVTSMERDPDLALAAMDRLADAGYGDRVLVSVGDGSLGAPDGRAVGRHRRRGRRRPSIPDPLREQLGDRRRLVIPVGGLREQQLLVVERTRQRVARVLGRAVRVRPAGRRGRLAAVGRDGALTASRSPGPVGILGRP